VGSLRSTPSCGIRLSHPSGTVRHVSVRPTPDQVLSFAPDRASAAAAVTVADPASWSATGCDDDAVWGRYLASTAEPYEVAVDLRGPAFRCSCPSRKLPCKHQLGLLLLHAHHQVAPANRLPFVARWLQQRRVVDAEDPALAASADAEVAGDRDGLDEAPASAVEPGGRTTPPAPPLDPQRERRKLDRAERMRAGLLELDRWVADRIRAGLAAPELADGAAWERLAARLVDAQCGSLANRVKRVAVKVNEYSGWQEDVLEELAVLHALSVAARRTGSLPEALADGVHVATGLTVGKDDVLAGVPSSGRWMVMGESRTREDRITVQRTWLCSLHDGRPSTWAMSLAFGAFGSEVASEFPVGHVIDADVFWYPGAAPLRAIVGRIHAGPLPADAPPIGTAVVEALDAAGWAIAAEPWLERYPLCVSATPAPLGNGRWTLTDATGSIPIVPGFWRLAELVAVSGGAPVTVAGEWSADGILPLTVWADGSAVAL